MKRAFSLIVLCLCATAIFSSQLPKYPFPQNIKYPFGLMSGKITSDKVKTWYDAWKKKYLQECNGNLRPGVDPLTNSLVEAQGFAMVAVAYMGDKETFDKLYAYYKIKCTSSGCGLMGWKQTCDGWVDQGSATDGDVDVASALIVADWQWPNEGYADKAKSVITNLKKVVTTCSGVYSLCGGCGGGSPWGGCNETDISYYSPAFFRYFAKVSGDDSWTKLADDTHTIRDAAANATTGLVPDWQTVSGTAGAGGRKGYFSFDAIRAPYKQTLDYLWNGNVKGLSWGKKISSWAYGIGVNTIKDEYQLNGTAMGSNHNLAAVGSLAVAAMTNTQQVLDAFVEESMKLRDDYWYSGYLGNLYLLALTGNMWNPEIVHDNTGATPDGIRTNSSPGRVRIKIGAKRGLTVSGLSDRACITITTFTGQRLRRAISFNKEGVSLDISTMGSGCYLLTISDDQGKMLQNHIVSFF
jgi:endo-1,4-beta-D-glucanase Y